MSKRAKGLSFDEKKRILTKAMTDEALYYNFKELEVLAKKKGIVPQSVKEVLDCLIAERIVIQEKIGSLNIFWAFASNEASALGSQLSSLEVNLAATVSQRESADASLRAFKEEFPDVTPLEVAAILKEVSDLETLFAEQSERLQTLLRSDPTTIAKLQEQLVLVKTDVNQWTDNVFILRQFICNKLNAPEESVNKTFGIPQDFDTID